MYKTVAILYIVCFVCYVLFSRVPDYFNGDFTGGTVTKAIFSAKDKHPVVVVAYSVGAEKIVYTTSKWFLTSHKQGQRVTIIYNPSDPAIACIYTFIGYWVNWDELFFTAIVFIILFIAAVTITGKTNVLSSLSDTPDTKRKYDD